MAGYPCSGICPDCDCPNQDYQNQPASCMPGYPCSGICPVCECPNNGGNEQQKGTTLSNYMYLGVDV